MMHTIQCCTDLEHKQYVAYDMPRISPNCTCFQQVVRYTEEPKLETQCNESLRNYTASKFVCTNRAIHGHV